MTCCTDRNPVSWNQNLRQPIASEHTLQHFSMNAEGFGSLRNAFLISGEGLLDIELLELVQRFIQKDVAIEHVFDDSF